MEQQLENHMRLPRPVTNGNPNASTGPDFTTTTTTTLTPTTITAATTTATTTPLHQSSQQHMPPTQLAHSHPSSLSPQFGTAHATVFYGAGSPHHHQHHHQQHLASSLSPRSLASIPGYSPPSYAFSQHNHDPATLSFPEAPSTELAPLQLNAPENHVDSLPSLASLTGPSSASSSKFGRSSVTSDTSYSPPSKPRGWPSGNPYTAYYTAGHGQSADSPARMDVDNMSNGTRGPLSPDNMGGRASSVSLDDPDVKMAAEALGDLKANFISSPRNRTTPLPNSPSNHFGTPGPEAEPLLSLVMTSGSLLAKPIEGTVSAYNTTKNRTPGFIKTPVEYVEGVVGSGLHLSGIEGGVRWFFRGKGRQHSSSDLETGENSHKRRRVNGNGGRTSVPSRRPDVAPLTTTNGVEVDPYGFADKDRRLSMSTVDTLPAYDDARSPAYTENALATPSEKAEGQVGLATSPPSSTTPTAWQSRLMMSTSGLSIAMSEESLRSLKYCLSWLRWANEHIGRVIAALKENLEQYESHGHIRLSDGHAMNDDPAQARRELGARISALRCDVLKTLQGVIETVSKYAGGALPDNARALVRRHLTSLPQRFRLATQESSTNGSSESPAQADASTEEGQEKEVREGAQRVLVLAKEGLDMMAQVSGVLDGTIVSAEEWCERLGRKRRNEQTQTGETQQQQQHQEEQQQQQHEPQVHTVPFTGVVADGDVKMG